MRDGEKAGEGGRESGRHERPFDRLFRHPGSLLHRLPLGVFTRAQTAPKVRRPRTKDARQTGGQAGSPTSGLRIETRRTRARHAGSWRRSRRRSGRPRCVSLSRFPRRNRRPCPVCLAVERMVNVLLLALRERPFRAYTETPVLPTQ